MRSAVLLATVTGRADEDLALAPRTQKQSGIVHRSSRRGGLDDPTSPGNTGLGAVCKCGSGRSLGRDRQVNSVRGCVGLFADSDLTPTLPRRHRGYATRRHCAIGNIGAGGKQQQDSGGVAATTQSMFALFQQTQLMRAVRQIPALLRSHQHRGVHGGARYPWCRRQRARRRIAGGRGSSSLRRLTGPAPPCPLGSRPSSLSRRCRSRASCEAACGRSRGAGPRRCPRARRTRDRSRDRRWASRTRRPGRAGSTGARCCRRGG